MVSFSFSSSHPFETRTRAPHAARDRTRGASVCTTCAGETRTAAHATRHDHTSRFRLLSHLQSSLARTHLSLSFPHPLSPHHARTHARAPSHPIAHKHDPLPPQSPHTRRFSACPSSSSSSFSSSFSDVLRIGRQRGRRARDESLLRQVMQHQGHRRHVAADVGHLLGDLHRRLLQRGHAQQ